MILKRRNRFQRFWLRFSIARQLLFKKKHFIVLHMTREQLKNILLENQLKDGDEIDWAYAGMSLHIAQRYIKITSGNIDETDIICNKASWEVNAIEILNKKKWESSR